MALFPKDDTLPEEETAQRRAWTQETGTRRLVIGFVVFIALWFIGGRLWDLYLLRHKWPALPPEDQGVTVIGTLDRRGDYDRNMFRVVQSEGQVRAEVTNFGWESIFNGEHGKRFTPETGGIIRNAIQLDGETGYGMLVPFLRAGMLNELKSPHAFEGVNGDFPVTTTLDLTRRDDPHKRLPPHKKPLAELLEYFGAEGRGSKNADASDATEGGGTGSEHSIEHGLAIPAEVLIQTCPVVLVGSDFTGGWVEEHPSVLGTKTYSLWLTLSPEGKSRFYQWSRDHVKESLLIVLNHRVVAHGRIAFTMNEDRWEITNIKDGESAQDLVNYINKQRH